MKIDVKKIEMLLAERTMTKTELFTLSKVAPFPINKKRNTRPDTVGRLAKALNCEVADIIQEV